MPHVVTMPCFGCKHQECTQVCPADCFHEGDQMLYIDPESCVDCEACRSVCPEEAIYPDDEVPTAWQPFIALNAEMSKVTPYAG